MESRWELEEFNIKEYVYIILDIDSEPVFLFIGVGPWAEEDPRKISGLYDTGKHLIVVIPSGLRLCIIMEL